MRSRIVGNGIRIDLLPNRAEVSRVVNLALQAGFTNVSIALYDDGLFGVDVTPEEGSFATEELAGMLTVVAGVLGTTPETLIAAWRDRDEAQPAARAPRGQTLRAVRPGEKDLDSADR